MILDSVPLSGNRRTRSAFTTGHPVLLAGFALALGMSALSAGMSAANAAGQTSPAALIATPATLISSTTYPVPVGFRADARLLVHTMPSITGEPTRASTLLFVPHGTPPAGGWPVIAWAHGTTTPGQKTCAPSLTPEDLDGGLTREGFKSDYTYQLGQLVNAGYAVVAPDFEGLGAVASVRLPYYGAASLARSLIAGVQAARAADPTLSSRWAVVGHSDGGHAVLGVEAHTAEAPELALVGTVALAPYTSIEAGVTSFAKAGRNANNKAEARNGRKLAEFNVAMMTVGLTVQSPDFDPSGVMGNDLKQTLPVFVTRCSPEAIAGIGDAIQAKGTAFRGFKPGWAANPRMKAFLAANDPAVMPGVTLRKPTLIVQGTADTFVLEPLTTKFVAKLRAAGAPITYKEYPGADHFTVIRQAEADVLAFLHERFAN